MRGDRAFGFSSTDTSGCRNSQRRTDSRHIRRLDSSHTPSQSQQPGSSSEARMRNPSARRGSCEHRSKTGACTGRKRERVGGKLVGGGGVVHGLGAAGSGLGVVEAVALAAGFDAVAVGGEAVGGGAGESF